MCIHCLVDSICWCLCICLTLLLWFNPIVVTFLLFLPASISYRLLCGQGLIMACIKSVFNKLELVTWTCYTLNEIHLKNVYNIKGNMLDGRDYFHVPMIISWSWTSLLKLCSKQNVWSPVLWTCEIQHAIFCVKVKNDFLVLNLEKMPGISP